MAPKCSIATPTGTISRFFAPKQSKTDSDVSPTAVKPTVNSTPPPAISVTQPTQPSQVAVNPALVESKESTAPAADAVADVPMASEDVLTDAVPAAAQAAPKAKAKGKAKARAKSRAVDKETAAAAPIPVAADFSQLGERAARTGGSFSELQLGSKKHPLLCTCDAELATEWAQDVQRSIDTGLSTEVACVMGLDCEWAAPWFRPGCAERLATLQLCHYGTGGLRVLALHVVGFERKLPEGVLSLLADTRIAKVGAGVVGDACRLVRDFGCTVRGLYDLSSMDAGKKAVSLEDMVRAHCPSELHITKAAAIGDKGVRTSNWEAWPLSAEQIDYCAKDAALSVLAFVHRFSMAEGNSLSESAREALVNLKHAEVDEVADVPMTSEEKLTDPVPEAQAAPKAKAMGRAKAKAKSQPVEAAPSPEKDSDAAKAAEQGPEVAESTPKAKKRKAEGEVKTAKKTKQDDGIQGGDAEEGDGKKQKRVLTDEQKAHFFQCMRNKAVSPPNIGIKDHPKGAKDVLSKVVVVVSGILDSFERKDFEQYVKDHGGKVSSGVTAKVTHLVNDHGEAGPSKQAKCKEFGIPIVSEDVILKMVKDSLSA
eukprot:CAMPEP_0172683438 /NCGR_PEP_ID=MMETSP1074-20121228/18848_1 /TAXON_ID=2916 /ORGANISM="Ceratium fusus, Strain PA161109" /LENGTH=595 /DNA_ID=CAMNT_0013502283 /DNA_START=41 /DNA_END=1828 /DNA_ORIENTATION=-